MSLDARQHGGNLGYLDEPSVHYVFDTTVANARSVRAGDLAVLRDKVALMGLGWIDRVDAEPVEHVRRRCPQCRTTAFKPRRSLRPAYRCDDGHEFDVPLEERSTQTLFRTVHGRTWQALPGVLSARQLDALCESRSQQQSIRRIDLGRLRAAIEASGTLLPDSWWNFAMTEGGTRVVPGRVPTARRRRRLSWGRDGQEAFRDLLLALHGPTCAVTGAQPDEVLDAAHIVDFSESPSHAPENGLLLRRDIHALFDAGLLAIDPDGLVVRVAPQLRGTIYAGLGGVRLNWTSSTLPGDRELREHLAWAQERW